MELQKIFVPAVIALMFLVGAAVADTGTINMPETQGLTTGTTIQALGTVTETDGLVWTLDTDQLPPDLPLMREIIYTTSYSEDTIADQGLVTYTKSAALDTGPMVAGQYNFKTAKVVEFVGLDTGRMITSEDEVIDGAMGYMPNADEVFICPFLSLPESYIPTFCNIEQMGSTADLTIGSLATTTDERHVAKSGDPGVAMDYSVKLTGFGDIPAMGSATAFINVHIQEARTLGDDEGEFLKAEDLVYGETTTAAGEITLFQKVMGFDSKVTGALPTELTG
ncbi:hypothetical protein J2741_000927 [Methanolinea mesophila]|uniref:hypothetical protein n=1 Tax=Methanolinea mesophila TaxID=547055 RepID=UPI001AE26C61|nr:hypothetical protein [Methanolinea mesophila]MBP1928380.1 hypothetical protein [Methanolinea mesophila]